MLQRLHLLNNVGSFHQFTGDPTTNLAKLSLIYGENGRGKTTISSVLRSLANSSPTVILERKRLGGTGDPHIVIHRPSGTPPCIFQAGGWQGNPPPVFVFDDFFVDENVYSGLSVSATQRQSLHEVVVGARGVALARAVEDLTGEIRQITDRINAATRDVQSHVPRGMSVDAFLVLQPNPTVDESIAAIERRIEAVRQAAPVRQTSVFDPVQIAAIDGARLTDILSRTVNDLDTEAANRVRTHIADIGPRAEQWIASGIERAALPAVSQQNRCPLCIQDLRNSPIFTLYRSYFSQAYSSLKAAIEAAITEVESQVGDAVVVEVQQATRQAERKRDFWARFTSLPVTALPLESFVAAATAGKAAILALLRAKQAAPLDAIAIPTTAEAAITAFNSAAQSLRDAFEALRSCNPAIEAIKQGSGTDTEEALAPLLSNLLAVKARFTPEASAACATLIQEKSNKTAAEGRKETARTALDQYRATVFPQYTSAINRVLSSFNAGFSIELQPENPGGRPSTGYHVVINNAQVPLNSPSGRPPSPTFRTALSAGDRATLALAFFFASLETHSQLATAVVVIDDPVSSLDDFRAGTTVSRIKSLVTQAAQVVVLSHSKPFLCQFWEDDQMRQHIVPLKIARHSPGSKLERWDIQAEWYTEHDRRQELMLAYLKSAASVDARQVAESIRPHLEACCRVAFPEVAKPGKLLGPIINDLRQRAGGPDALLDATGCTELDEIKDYGNKFHHDGSPAWRAPAINDRELEGFVKRTLKFIR